MQFSRVGSRSVSLVVTAIVGVGAIGLQPWSQLGAANAAGSLTQIGSGGASAAVVADRIPTTTGPAGPVVLPSGGTWANVTSNLAGMSSECGNLTMISAVPGQDAIIAGIAQHGLWHTLDGGTTWTPLGTSPNSATITNRPSAIVYDPTASTTFWESGIYNSGGVYKTTDNGTTFQRLGNITHIDQIAVDLTDPNRHTLLAGAHEASQTLYHSTDAGQTWTNIGANLPTGTGFSTNPIIINATTYLINTNPSWAGGTPGIYRTTNSGTTWTKVSTQAPTGQAAITPTTIYWRTGNNLTTSTDQGQTWTTTPANLAIDPTILPDSRLLAATNTHLTVSADGGHTWTDIGPTLPYTPADAVYLPTRHSIYISQWDCGNFVLPNAIERLQ